MKRADVANQKNTRLFAQAGLKRDIGFHIPLIDFSFFMGCSLLLSTVTK